MTTQTSSTSQEPSANKNRRVRSLNPSVTFPSGYAEGWVIAVPAWYRHSIDIELTERVVKDPVTNEKNKKMVWTEGIPQIYSFSTGDVFYNTRTVYEKQWCDALADITLVLQVASAMPDKLRGKTSKVPGWVQISEYRPRPDRSGLDMVASHRMTQDEFIATLKTGILPNGTHLHAQPSTLFP